MHQELSGYRACILKLQNKNSQTSTAKLCCLLPALKMGLLLSRSLLSRQHWKIVSFQMVNQLTSSSSSSSYNIHIYIYTYNWCIYLPFLHPNSSFGILFSLKLSSQHSHASLPQFFRQKCVKASRHLVIWISGSSALVSRSAFFSSSPRRR